MSVSEFLVFQLSFVTDHNPVIIWNNADPIHWHIYVGEMS